MGFYSRHKDPEARKEIVATGSSDAEQPNRPAERFQRAVAVYGMITVRTDGHRIVIAQKLERARSSSQSWDYHCLVPGPGGLAYDPHA